MTTSLLKFCTTPSHQSWKHFTPPLKKELLFAAEFCLRTGKGNKKLAQKIVTIKREELSNSMYEKYKLSIIPLECLINLCLLLKKFRTLIQYDRFLYTKEIWSLINKMIHAKELSSIVSIRADEKGNVIVYIKNKKIDEIISRESYSEAFGKFLDPFYRCRFEGIYTSENLSRIAINVLGPVSGKNKMGEGKIDKKENYIGPILVQMCTPTDLSRKINIIVSRYKEYQKVIKDIDTNLQVQLEVYTKPGLWKDSPSFITTNLKQI